MAIAVSQSYRPKKDGVHGSSASVWRKQQETAEERIWMFRENLSTITEWSTGPTGIDIGRNSRREEIFILAQEEDRVGLSCTG